MRKQTGKKEEARRDTRNGETSGKDEIKQKVTIVRIGKKVLICHNKNRAKLRSI